MNEGGGVVGLEAARPRLLDRAREAIRRRHYSYRTEETYVHWMRPFILFSGRRHPKDLGAAEVTAFLNHLAQERHVAAATQNQALAALLFLDRSVLEQLKRGGAVVRRPLDLPTTPAS